MEVTVDKCGREAKAPCYLTARRVTVDRRRAVYTLRQALKENPAPVISRWSWERRPLINP